MDEEGCGRKTAATSYEYDHSGNLTRIRLPYGGEIRREYDKADRIISETHVERSTGIRNTTRFTYDKADNLTIIQDNRGSRTYLEYNLLNQEIRRKERDGGITRTFYDLNGRVILPREYRRAGEEGCGLETVTDNESVMAEYVAGSLHMYQYLKSMEPGRKPRTLYTVICVARSFCVCRSYISKILAW